MSSSPAIIIPAHNEANVIRHTLDCLLAGLTPGEITVVVAANGCTDNTAEVARAAADWITVLDLAIPGKVSAIRAAEQSLPPGPRLYLDADVCLSGASAKAVLHRLAHGAGGARPPAISDLDGATWLVHSYQRARSRLANVQAEFSGGGCYGLSEDVRALFGEFPDVLGDDLFAARIVPEGRMEIVDVPPVTIHPPRNAASLRKVLARNVRGNRQLSELFPEASPLTTKQTVKSLVRSVRGPRSFVDGVVYAAFVIAGRMTAQSGARWERDESTRGGRS